MLEVTRLRIAYDRVVAVHGLNLRVEEGEIVAIVGPNGAGKTSTMMAISGVVVPEAGGIRFRGEKTSPARPPMTSTGAASSRSPRAG